MPKQIQPRIRGVVRTPQHTAVADAIERAISRECTRYNVSRSFVIANALAFTFGIETADYLPAKTIAFRQRKQRRAG